MADRLRVTLVKSPISHTQRTRGTVRALGLHRLGETVEVPDTPAVRGMTRAVRFLLRTEEISSEAASPAAAPDAPPEQADDERVAGTSRRRRKKEEGAT